MRFLAGLAVCSTVVAAAPPANAIPLVIHLHYENFAAPGQQADEADLIGWRVALENPAGQSLADLGTTQANGDTLSYDAPAGSYVVVLALPDPSPYDIGAVWPTNLRFPFTLDATDSEGNPIPNYRVRIGLGCGCDDGDECTNDLCDAGYCSTTPNLRPELPEICDGVDNDCDRAVDEGLPVPCSGNLPALVGCSDGTREGYMDFLRYPDIAACGGAWDRPGLDGTAGAPSCGHRAGNHSSNRAGAGCHAADLCAPGWHICRGPDELAERANGCTNAIDTYYPNFGTGDFGSGNGGPLAPYPGGAFFLARGALDGSCFDAVNGLPAGGGGIFGCGNMGLSDNRCGKFLRSAGALCGGLRDEADSAGDNPATDWAYDEEDEWAWSCTGAQPGSERDFVTKRHPDRQGGVLCCRDAAPGLAEVCDGIDNDLDGVIDDLREGRVGQSCHIEDDTCGTVECDLRGGLVCLGIEDCDDSSCDGVDDDGDGETDEAAATEPITCGTGFCAAAGERSCDDGEEEEVCEPGAPNAERDTTCDGVDDDCDGLTDEEWSDVVTTCGLGVCRSTGVRTCDDGRVVDTCVAGLPLSDTDATCNGIDENCSGEADDDWVETPTSCGAGDCAGTGVLACIDGVPTNTCTPRSDSPDDADCDGVDDDCDGLTDENFEPHVSTCGQGVCASEGFATCELGVLRDDCVPEPAPTSTDDDCDGVDDDCDGETDEDYVGATLTCGRGGCTREGAVICAGGEEVESCEPGTPAPDDATCDGTDDDCDGDTDEDYRTAATSCGVGACEGNRGQATCEEGVLVDSCDPLSGATSESCDGTDEDCDGETDEDFGAIGAACDGDDGDQCADGILSCSADQLTASCDEEGEGNFEICNQLDDDCDGATDEDLGECVDGDGDGLPDPTDNCPSIANPDQSDGDQDGIGDVCDQLIQGAGGDCAGGGNAPWAWWLIAAVGGIRWRRRRRIR